MTLPLMPPADGGAWLWKDPHGRGTVIVPGAPACIYELPDPSGFGPSCGKPGRRYACGYRCPGACTHSPR
jgi:hypothetical protein